MRLGQQDSACRATWPSSTCATTRAWPRWWSSARTPTAFAVAGEIGYEYCLRVTGTIRQRLSVNDKLKTGTVELVADTVEILNAAKDLPFALHENPNEDMRMTYRYLDLRRPEMQAMMRKRIKLVQALRRYLDERGFQDIETPILTKATPEGARDYLVPSRVHPGQFYALPQSPQLFKQILMMAGFDRYYQIARCFRDEDLRADRQPEFTQLDLEFAFVEEKDVQDFVEELIRHVFREVQGVELDATLPAHDLGRGDASLRFGQAGPAHRAGAGRRRRRGEARRVQGVRRAGQRPGRVAWPRCACPGPPRCRARRSTALTEYVGRYGAKGLAWLKVEDLAKGREGINSPVAKFLDDAALDGVLERHRRADRRHRVLRRRQRGRRSPTSWARCA